MAEKSGVYQVWHKEGRELVHVADVHCGNLLAALVFTLHPKDGHWQDNPQVTALVGNARSTTFGDRIVDPDGTVYSVHNYEEIGAGFKEIMPDLDPLEHGHLTLADLAKEIRDDEALAKREDAHYYPKESLQAIRDGTREVEAAEKSNDKGIER